MVHNQSQQNKIKKKNIHIKHFTHLSKWSRVKNSKAKFVADETCLLLVRVVSVKEVFLLLPSTLRHKCNGMYFLFNTFIF